MSNHSTCLQGVMAKLVNLNISYLLMLHRSNLHDILVYNLPIELYVKECVF
jgi:hypothetical protein